MIIFSENHLICVFRILRQQGLMQDNDQASHNKRITHICMRGF